MEEGEEEHREQGKHREQGRQGKESKKMLFFSSSSLLISSPIYRDGYAGLTHPPCSSSPHPPLLLFSLFSCSLVKSVSF